MSLLRSLEPFKKFGVVEPDIIIWSQRLYGGQKALKSSTLVQTLELGFEALTKLNNNKRKFVQKVAKNNILLIYSNLVPNEVEKDQVGFNSGKHGY